MQLKTEDSKYIIVELDGKNIPIVKIQSSTLKDGRIDVRASFFGTQHHYSFHQAKIIADTDETFQLDLHKSVEEIPKAYSGNDPIVYTSFDLKKPPSTWDWGVKSVAIKKGLNPETHIKYYDNRILPLGSRSNFFLGGRQLSLESRKLYPPEKCLVYEAEKSKMFFETCFTKNDFDKKPDIEVNTDLGKLGFYFTENPVFSRV